MKKINSFRPYFNYSKQQRLGLVVLLSLMGSLQFLCFFIRTSPALAPNPDAKQWLALQPQADSTQSFVHRTVWYPFNPNYITAFKGYKMGMSVAEIDRLHAWRKQGKFVNSAEEFQNVTRVSDSLLAVISPHFKFPDWVKNRKFYIGHRVYTNYPSPAVKAKRPKIDINNATKEELMRVYGIGEAISDRILKQKEIFGNFVSMDQLQDIWGLSPEVIDQLQQGFAILESPNPKKWDINNASVRELGRFPYFRYPISKNIVTYRSMHGDIKREDLENIKDFPLDKIKIIALYLDF